MKVAVCQTCPKLLDLQHNLQEVSDKIKKCKDEGADLVVFPELALTGYFVGQQYHKVALRLDSNEIMELAKTTQGTAAVIGFIEESPAMNFYNSALVAVNGEILFAYRKLNLPNYGVFEERKFFSPGKQIPIFKLYDFSIAVFICNDLWHPSLPYLGVCQKADIFISIFNSSQGSMGTEFSNIESWGIINKFYSRIFGIYNLCANRVGNERLELYNGEDRQEDQPVGENKSEPYRFWGGSEIVNPFGQVLVQAALYNEDIIFADLSRDLLRKKKILLPYLRNDDPYFTHRELGRILFDSRSD